MRSLAVIIFFIMFTTYCMFVINNKPGNTVYVQTNLVLLGIKIKGLMDLGSCHVICGNPLYAFKSNIIFFICPKHKETTEGV